MSDDDTLIIYGIGFLAGIVLSISFLLATGGFYGDGYQQAYEDLRNHKIEAVVQKGYPALWIKHNAPKLPPSEREDYHVDKE